MRIECAYTFDEYREASLALARSQDRRWFTTLGYSIVVVAGAILVFVIVVVRIATRATGGSIWPELQRNAVFIALALALCVRVFWLRSSGIRRGWKHQPELQLQRSIDISETSLLVDDSRTRVEFRWDAFRGLLETPKLFVLLPNDLSVVMIPKRAVPPGEIDALRFTLNERLTLRGAFPVLPPKPAESHPS